MKCLGVMGWIFGHEMEARITVKEVPHPHELSSFKSGGGIGPEEIRRLRVLQEETYHGDVCVRCGTFAKPEQ